MVWFGACCGDARLQAVPLIGSRGPDYGVRDLGRVLTCGASGMKDLVRIRRSGFEVFQDAREAVMSFATDAGIELRQIWRLTANDMPYATNVNAVLGRPTRRGATATLIIRNPSYRKR